MMCKFFSFRMRLLHVLFFAHILVRHARTPCLHARKIKSVNEIPQWRTNFVAFRRISIFYPE